ncbi:MAG: DUF192 domain-containing protein [Ignavibacteriae bacterium]|nr:MAG: DUF192 domain-containing protein [Ignavibacteriota bacterium]
MKNNILKFSMVFLFGSLFFTNVVCKKEEPPKLDTTKKTDNPTINFVKQGEVYFQDKNKNLIRKVDVEIAESDETRHRGLMFRDKMNEEQGMLFIFPIEEEQGFYMKNTILPLDIIFINKNKQIIKIYKNTTPFSEKTLPSGKPTLYVVEVNAGYTDKYNIKEGDFIDWRKQ